MGFCYECKHYTQVVFDHRTGDTICTECGGVLEARGIEETREWRTFGDDSRDNDPVRVGEACNPLLDGGLETFISDTKGSGKDGARSSLIRRWQSKAGLKPEQSLTQGFGVIDTMADRLGLLATIKGRANEIFKKVDDARFRQKNQGATLAACLYIACRQEGNPRTFKEICSVAEGATVTAVAKVAKWIEQLGVAASKSIDMGTIHAADFLNRFGSYLGMRHHEIKAAVGAAQRTEELDIRRSPISVAAAVICMISQLSTEKKSLKEISLATKVAESTIKSTYKDLYPHASKIIPASYAKEDDLKKLFRP